MGNEESAQGLEWLLGVAAGTPTYAFSVELTEVVDRIDGYEGWVATVGWTSVGGRLVANAIALHSTRGEPVTAKVIRSLPTAEIVRAARKAVLTMQDEIIDHDLASLGGHPREPWLEFEETRRPGRRFDRNDDFYRRIANLYLASIDDPARSRVVAEHLASEHDVAIPDDSSDDIVRRRWLAFRGQVRGWIAEARRREYIPKKGESAGD